MSPYISQSRREGNLYLDAGHLTFGIQQQLKTYIERHGLSYQTLAECLGALEGAKADLIRRRVEPYEEIKQDEHGDCW